MYRIAKIASTSTASKGPKYDVETPFPIPPLFVLNSVWCTALSCGMIIKQSQGCQVFILPRELSSKTKGATFNNKRDSSNGCGSPSTSQLQFSKNCHSIICSLRDREISCLRKWGRFVGIYGGTASAEFLLADGSGICIANVSLLCRRREHFSSELRRTIMKFNRTRVNTLLYRRRVQQRCNT